jgi:hypothetical protein
MHLDRKEVAGFLSRNSVSRRLNRYPGGPGGASGLLAFFQFVLDDGGEPFDEVDRRTFRFLGPAEF